MEFFYIYWDCPSLFCTVRPARCIRNKPLKTVQTCPLWWKVVFTIFNQSKGSNPKQKKRYKFDFLTENRFKPRSPLRTWPKNGHQNEIEKLKKVLVRDEFGWDNNELGKVMGSFSYGYMMSQIIGGFLADKFGGAIVMTYCGVIWSILTYLTPTLVRHR